MRVFRDLNHLPTFNKSVITIGTFDGVHIGHQKLIQRINQISKKTKSENIIITFHPHPRIVINPQDSTLRLLNTIDEKIALLEKYGVDNLVIVPFSRDFSEQEAETYVRDFLVRNFSPGYIVIGYDHKFGKNRSGDYMLLEKLKARYGYELEEIDKQTLDDIGISSTKIRMALEQADIKFANELLGHPYTLTGTVIKGLQNGRKLGFPTANLQLTDEYKLIPACGIYAVLVHHAGIVHKGMLSIGFNPTFGGTVKSIEANILDFDKDIYGEVLTLELIEFLREEKKFDSVEELIAAIHQDEINTRKLFSS